MKTLEPHPLAEGYPLMAGAEYEAFKADIQANGLILPIWLYQGKVLDGRNRYRALVEIGTPTAAIPVRDFSGTEGQALAFVASLNLHRRHLPDAATRREAVHKLREQGMSTRQIASAVGVDQKQVRKDLNVKPTVEDRSSTVFQTESDGDPHGECNDGEQVPAVVIGPTRTRDAGDGFGIGGGAADRPAGARLDGGPAPSLGGCGRGKRPDGGIGPVAGRTITGRDGKQYAATKPQRKPADQPAKPSRAIILAGEAIDKLKAIPAADPRIKDAYALVRRYINDNIRDL